MKTRVSMHLAAITVAGYGRVVKSETARRIYELTTFTARNTLDLISVSGTLQRKQKNKRISSALHFCILQDRRFSRDSASGE